MLSAEDVLSQNVLLGRLQDWVAWNRQKAGWPFRFGLSCCYAEMKADEPVQHGAVCLESDIARVSPQDADSMAIAGTVSLKMAPLLRRLYEQMKNSRWVISLGTCANSGGMYDIYSVVQGIDRILPVDLYVPGCPPSLDALKEGLAALAEFQGEEKRPLGWMMGPRGLRRGPSPEQRDLQQARSARFCISHTGSGLTR